MSLLDRLDPVRLFGLDLDVVPDKIMRELEHKGEYMGIIYGYKHVGGKILRHNIITGRCTFYDSDGRRAFSSQ